MSRRIILLVIICIITLYHCKAAVAGIAWNKKNTDAYDAIPIVMKCLSGLYKSRNRIDSIEAETYMYGTACIQV